MSIFSATPAWRLWRCLGVASLVWALGARPGFAYQPKLPAISVPRQVSAPSAITSTVLGCEISANAQAVKGCLDAAVQRLERDVATAKETARDAQRRLDVPWVSAMTQFDGARLQACLAERGIDLRAIMLASGQAPAEFIRGRLMAAWQRGIGSGALIGRAAAGLTSNGTVPTPADIVNRADELAAQVAAQDPLTQCIWRGVEPVRAQAKQLALQLYPALKAQLDTLIEQQVRPAISGAVLTAFRNSGQMLSPTAAAGQQVVGQSGRFAGQAMRTGAQAAGRYGAIPDAIRLAALGRAMRYMMDPARMTGINAQINALATATQAGNAAAAAAALAALERDLPNAAALNDEFALAVGIEIIRGQGHEIIETVGSVPVDLVLWSFDKYADGLSDTIDFTASVGWVASAGFVGLWSFMMSSMLDLHLWMIKTPAIKAAQFAYDQAVDAAFRALRERRSPAEMIATAGPFGELLREFPTAPQVIAMSVPEIQEAQNSLARYHQSVLQLSRAAARLRQTQ